jgi:HlyD family secretion protein
MEERERAVATPCAIGKYDHRGMTQRKVLVATIALVAIAVTVWMVRRSKGATDVGYRFATVTVGNIQQTVSATGTLNAVTTVQVGTQVSGQVSAIFADFNSRVTKGELLARIDPTLQQQAVSDAQAQLEKAQAQLKQAQQEYDRNVPLIQQKFISASEFGTVQVNLSVAQATVKSAQVALDKAKQNLSYTNIYAPINGVVVERDVDVGQTVAASLSAPQLFLIAQDLSRMEILVAVDESDISSIKDSQPVKFTVQSFQTRTFDGVVQQVRLQSKLTDNVVSYTVVVTLSNADGVLLPGMTATVEFIVASATNVLGVPASALRFKPTADELAAAGLPPDTTTTGRGGRGRGGAGGAVAAGQTPPATSPTGSAGPATAPVLTTGQAAGSPTPGATATRASRSGAGSGGFGTLWTLDSNQKLKRMPVRVGLSDGQRTQVSGTGVVAGLQVIIGSTAPAATAPAAPSANPLAPTGRAGGGGRGGG